MSGRLLVNAAIKHYQIERHLAAGGMSNVYLARDTYTGTKVAIKIVPQDISDYSERFLREAKATRMLQHQHILPALEYGEYQSWYYLVTPYIAAGSLREYLLREKTLDIQRAGLILSQLTSAIQYAHERGILHRDIKAANVLMLDPEYVYLADFGLAKSNDDDYSLTQTGYLIGTPEYIAPELMEQDATPASDIYALGVLLFLMLTGVTPFRGPTPMSVILKHLNEPAPLLTDYNPAVSRSIELVVLRALSKNPADRYQSASALMQAYQNALDEAEHTVSLFAVAPEKASSVRVLPISTTLDKTTCKTSISTTSSINEHPRLVGAGGIVGACLLGAVMLISNNGLTNTDATSQVATHPVPTATSIPTSTPTPRAGSKRSTNPPTAPTPSYTQPTSANWGSTIQKEAGGNGYNEGNIQRGLPKKYSGDGNQKSHGKGHGRKEIKNR